MGFRAIQRVTKVNHNTVINGVKNAANKINDVDDKDYDLPDVGQIDELQTYVGKKSNKIWIWTTVDKFKPGILEWEIGDRTNKTLAKLWLKISRDIIILCPYNVNATFGQQMVIKIIKVLSLLKIILLAKLI